MKIDPCPFVNSLNCKNAKCGGGCYVECVKSEDGEKFYSVTNECKYLVGAYSKTIRDAIGYFNAGYFEYDPVIFEEYCVNISRDEIKKFNERLFSE